MAQSRLALLVLSSGYPMFDRASGDLRLYAILRILARKHAVLFCAYDPEYQAGRFGDIEVVRYRRAVADLGVTICERPVVDAMRKQELDAVIFEFYFAAEAYMEQARFWQPDARMIVDSVDVRFHRLLAKARVTGLDQDMENAAKARNAELAAYGKADLVLAVTDEDKSVLVGENCETPVEVVPNIHTIQPLEPVRTTLPNSLVFVGSFLHDPNVDAILYFCREILPRIGARVPSVRLRIIGSAAPAEIQALSGDGVDVLGYVPETRPFLETSAVSIAPLRYGAGMKGKIGEALSFGVPVVSTSVGIEGFGLTPGENVLVGDTPETFADNIVQLFADGDLRERIGSNGWRFIKERYSEDAVAARLSLMFERLSTFPVKKLALPKRLGRKVSYELNRTLLWRFR